MSGRGTRLRGHHLICLQFFHGEGYSAEFVINLLGIIKRLTAEGGTVVTGPDDVCAACPSLKDGSCAHKVHDEAAIQSLDQIALELLDLRPGDVFDFGETSMRTPRVLARWRDLACSDCEWHSVCGPLIDLSQRFPRDA